MPKSATPAAYTAGAHLQTLAGLHESLFAPQFRALETYGQPPPPPPSLADVITAARAALAWHRDKETDVAADLAARRRRGGNSVLMDEAARLLAYHRAEHARIAHDLEALEATEPAAATAA
jgi:hypothetical protein